MKLPERTRDFWINLFFFLGLAGSMIPDFFLYNASTTYLFWLSSLNTFLDLSIFIAAFVLLKIEMQKQRAARERVEVLNQHQTEFLQIVAHDLRNPLNAIVQASALLPPSEREAAHSIRSTANEMTEIIDAMLDMAALEKGKIKLRPADADLAEVVREVLERNRPHAERKRIALGMEEPEPCWARFDPGRIRQAVDNLVSNAIKFSPPGKAVQVSVRAIPDGFRIEVEDHGLGFTPEDYSRLFQRFTRLSARPTGGESSSGLGLANARHLVELHGGQIGAESAGPGQGSRFWIELPIGNAE